MKILKKIALLVTGRTGNTCQYMSAGHEHDLADRSHHRRRHSTGEKVRRWLAALAALAALPLAAPGFAQSAPTPPQDPSACRFLQRDPVGYDDQVNLYAYVRNDPVNRTDPTGLEEEDPRLTLRGLRGMAADAREHPLNDSERQVAGIIVRNAPITGPVTRAMEVIASVTGGAGTPTEPAVPGRASTLGVGPNAGESVRATSSRARAGERREVDRIGNERGCHTCGARESGNPSGHWTPDHQPPNALNPPRGQQRLLPHCADCRKRQAGEVTQEVMRRRRDREQ